MTWYTRLWWLIAPWMILLAGAVVWSETLGLYIAGARGLLHPLADLGIALLVLFLYFVIIASIVWVVGALIALLSARRPSAVVRAQGFALSGALLLFFVPGPAWEQLLLRTIGPGKGGGYLLWLAASEGDSGSLRQLLASGVPVGGRTQLRLRFHGRSYRDRVGGID
jgi:hypothetical protein